MATKNESRSIQEIIWGRKKTKIESACETSTGTCLKKAKKKNIKTILKSMSDKDLERMQKKLIQQCAEENDELKVLK